MKIVARKKFQSDWDFIRVEIPAGKKARWVAFEFVPSQGGRDKIFKYGMLSGGWNGSFHDSHYASEVMLVAWGSSPSRARKRLNSLSELAGSEGKTTITVSESRFYRYIGD